MNDIYMRCVQPAPQFGLYLAPMSVAFLRSIVRSGFYVKGICIY